jgi:hypothetical protein
MKLTIDTPYHRAALETITGFGSADLDAFRKTQGWPPSTLWSAAEVAELADFASLDVAASELPTPITVLRLLENPKWMLAEAGKKRLQLRIRIQESQRQHFRPGDSLYPGHLIPVEKAAEPMCFDFHGPVPVRF